MFDLVVEEITVMDIPLCSPEIRELQRFFKNRLGPRFGRTRKLILVLILLLSGLQL